MDDKQKRIILLTDDSEMNRAILADILEDEYKIIEAENGKQAIEIIGRLGTMIDVVLLDIVMPEMDGFEVLAYMNKEHWIENIPVIMISAETTSAYVKRAYDLGATDYITRPFDAAVVHRRVINTVMLYGKQKNLSDLVSRQIYENQRSNSLMISILSHIVEFRNGESGLHVLHINMITELLLKALIGKTDKYSLTQSDISMISMASSLHDIGKIAVPKEILNKPGRLTKEEFEVMKSHAVIGAKMLEDIPFDHEEPLLKTAYEICRWHHERYDGRGYPDGLKGEEIPISAQIVSLADVYDALTSERVYKPPYSHEEAMQMILEGQCGVFNPLLLECFQETSESIRRELKLSSLGSNASHQIASLTSEALNKEKTQASERSLRLLEEERLRMDLFAEMMQECHFEYYLHTDILSFSRAGAKQLNIQEIVPHPLEDKRIQKLVGQENLQDLSFMIAQTTPEYPLVKAEFQFHLDEGDCCMQLTVRSLWSDSEKPERVGLIGLLVNLQEEYRHLLRIKDIVSRDEKTGFLNYSSARLYLKEKMNNGYQLDFALAALDIDHYSEIEEQNPVLAAELRERVAECLKNGLRAGDEAVRVDGGQFLIFLSNPKRLSGVIDRIYHLLADAAEGAYTISMGVSTTENCERSFQALVHHAQLALKQAKAEGGARYTFGS